MADHIEIEDADGKWVVRAGGAIVAETTRALVLREGDYDPVVYFPRDDVAMAFLERSEKTTHCPHKGDATYYSIRSPSQALGDAAWSYEDPHADMVAIGGHLAFHPSDDIAVEEI